MKEQPRWMSSIKVVKLVYVKGNKKCTYDPNATNKSGFSDGDYNVERYTAGK